MEFDWNSSPDPSQPEAYDDSVRRLRVDWGEHHEFGINISPVTPLLVPDLLLRPLDTPRLFIRRVFRLVDCDLKVDFPEMTLDATRLRITELEERYNEEVKEMEEEPLIPITVSKKEACLNQAAEHILEGGKSLSDIAKLTGLKKGQVSSLKTRMMKSNSHVMPSKRGAPKKLSPEHIDFLKNLIDNEDKIILTLNDMKRELLANYPDIEKIDMTTIGRELKRQGYSFKKIATYPNKRNEPRIKNDRIRVSHKLIYCLYSNFQVIFVDETSIHLGAKAGYGWGRKGRKLSVPIPPKSENYSIITAITDSEVLGCQVVREGVKDKDYLGFLCNVIRFHGMDHRERELVIFMDNASIHKSDVIKTALKTKVTLLFNAAYSPMLNPIEEFFSKFKRLIRENSTLTEEELVLSIRYALNLFEASEMKGYIHHMLHFARESLDYNDIF